MIYLKVPIGNRVLVFDEEKLLSFLIEFTQNEFENMAEAMNREMAIQLQGFGGINAPQSWVDEFLANSKFEVTNEDGVFSVDLISKNIINLFEESEEATRARVIWFGTGKIITKPGEMTWQGGSTSQSRPGSLAMSKAEREYRIPQFEHTSLGFMNPWDSLVGMWNNLTDNYKRNLLQKIREVSNLLWYIE